MAIRDFYEKTTKTFRISLKFNGNVPDISNDIVTIILKENKNLSDSEASLEKQANVSPYGVEGIAEFNLNVEDTNIKPGVYFYEIKWESLFGVYILESGRVTVLSRVFD